MPKTKTNKTDAITNDDFGYWAAGPNSTEKVIASVPEGMWLHPDEIKEIKVDPEPPSSKVSNEGQSSKKKKKTETDTTDEAPPVKKKKIDNINQVEIKTSETVDIDYLRDEYESGAEWNIRRSFLAAHVNSYTLDRLICLSRCFINNEIYGCRYPDEVMVLLKTLRLPLSGVITDQKDRLKSKYEIPFVKSSETGGPESKIKQTGSGAGKSEKNVNKGMINFVKAGENYQSLDYSKKSEEGNNEVAEKFGKDGDEYHSLYDKMEGRIAKDELEKKFTNIPDNLRKLLNKPDMNVISQIYEAAQKCKFVVKSETEVCSDGFESCVYLDNILVGKGHGKNKKLARTNAHADAHEKLLKPNIKLSGTHPDGLTFVSSDDSIASGSGKPEVTGTKPASNNSLHVPASPKNSKEICPINLVPVQRDFGHLKKIFRNLKPFYLRELGPDSFDFPASCLRQTCDFQKFPLVYENRITEEGNIRCTLSIKYFPVAEGVANLSKQAEQEASRQALEKLRDISWTIRFKGQTDCGNDRMSKDSLMGENKDDIIEESEHGKKLTDSNIGSKLMRKMGWTGKGIGKNEQGREDPVLVKQVIHRSGLGALDSNSSMKKFESVMYKIVKDYYFSYEDTDMAFASDFSNDERKVIHNACRKFQLKSKSYGTGEERYLVISRPRSAEELFAYVRSKGGETTKYVLIPPRLEHFK
ncbi:uncharacterized protein LOC126808819 [Patella vulgata]|uniref:uncharacterized protein LOC126808819 n=1 Tax=Patella vulgata TaxID=6465 RepID=UPI00217FDFB1|nr:uncharacterized protein LOC126808819 [Patella vulgata]